MSPAELRSSLWSSCSISARCAAVSAALDVSRRSIHWYQTLPNFTFLEVASWMHHYDCRCFQQHLTIVFQSLRTQCWTEGGSGSVCKYLEALVSSPWVSGRCACGLRTEFQCADVHCVHEVHCGSSIFRCQYQVSTSALLMWLVLCQV